MRFAAVAALACAVTQLAVACTRESGIPRDSDAGTNNSTSAACYAMPDFSSCGQCVCNANASGCDALYAIQDETLICGQRCGPASPNMDCAPYCESVTAGMRDPERLDGACEACLDTLVDGDADVEAFDVACAESDGCTTALSALAMCPQT